GLSGSIPGTSGETWAGVDNALRNGLRTLPGDSSLAQLLAERCGARHIHRLPPLSEETILEWADAHYRRTGTWPSNDSGIIPGWGVKNGCPSRPPCGTEPAAFPAAPHGRSCWPSTGAPAIASNYRR